jgi:sulfur carrier protein
MKIVVNGDDVEVPDGATVRSVVEMMTETRGRKGIAVALNAVVVNRGAWDETTLSEEDQVEVLSAIGGG